MKKTRTTGYLQWNDFQKLLEFSRENDKMICAFVSIATYCGLRISDVLTCKWGDFDKEYVILEEKKTGKARKIPVHKDLLEIITSIRPKIKKATDPIFSNRSGSIMTQCYLNRRLKKTILLSGVPITGNISSHLLRKTFARHILDTAEDKGMALIMLMHIFNHSSLVVTKVYLGLIDEEIDNVYRSM